MIYGIAITLGIIFVIASRFLYCLYDMTLGGSKDNDFKGYSAIMLDIIGTTLVVWSAVNAF